MTTVVYVLESCSDHVHVVVCVHTTSDAEAEKVEATEAVLASYRVAVREDVSDLASTYTCLDIELDCKSLCRELLLRDLVEYAVCVNEDSVTTYRTLVWKSVLIELSSKVLYCEVWRKDQGLLSRSGRKRSPQSRDDGGVSWVFPSCGAREVRSPCAWRGGARPGSRVTGGD